MATYYVATNGSDSNNGSSGSPWLTITKAAATAVAGDTVQVASGTYNSASINCNNSGTSGARIRFVSTVKWGAKVIYNGSGGSGTQCWNVNGNYIDVVGFDLTASVNVARLGIYIVNKSYCRIQNNFIHDLPGVGSGGSGGAGIVTDQYTTTGNEVSGNLICRIGPDPTTVLNELIHGIYLSDLYGYCWNNICLQNAGWGICCFHNAQGYQIANNICGGNGAGILVAAQTALTGGTPGDYFTVSNNICYQNVRYGIDNRDTVGTHNVYLNNCFWQNGSGVSSLSSGNTLVNSVLQNPLFVNYQLNGTGNYALQAGSPCINAGTSTGAPSIDYAGTSRPQGGAYDIGAYEAAAGSVFTGIGTATGHATVTATGRSTALSQATAIGAASVLLVPRTLSDAHATGIAMVAAYPSSFQGHIRLQVASGRFRIRVSS